MSLTLATLLISALASADPPTFAHNSTPLGDAVCVVRIDLNTPYAPGPSEGLYRVSGTDCNFTIGTPSIVHDEAVLSIVESSLTIGGVAITVPSQCKGAAVRFASTHFPDSNDDLTITWKCKFRYEDPVHNFSGTSDWVSVDFHVNPYNKAFFMGTILGPNGQQNPAFATHTKSSAIIAKTALTSLGHTASPTTDSAIISQSEGNVLHYTETQTAFFAMVHGNINRFNDSIHSHNDPSTAGLIVIDDETDPTVAGEIKAINAPRPGNYIPRFSTAVFYACDLLANEANPWLAWNPQVLEGSIRDAALLGFPMKISLKLKLGVTDDIEVIFPDPIPDWIDSHVQKLYEKWSADDIVLDAVRQANAAAMPRGTPYQDSGGTWWIPAVAMDFRGDANTTIHWVYLTADERAQLSSEESPNWYHVWSN